MSSESRTVRVENATDASAEFIVQLLTEHGIDADCIEVENGQ